MLERLKKRDFLLAFINLVLGFGCPPGLQADVKTGRQVAEPGVFSVGTERPRLRGVGALHESKLPQEIQKLLEDNDKFFPSTS